MGLAWGTPTTDRGTLRATFTTTSPTTGEPVTIGIEDSRGHRHIIRGWHLATAPAVGLVIDHELPLNEEFTLHAWDAQWVSLASVLGLVLASDAPMVSDPLRGRPIPVTIASWPDRTAERAGQSLTVPGAKAPIIIDGLEHSPMSTIRLLHNQTADSASRLAEQLDQASLLLIRPSCPHIEPAWASARGRSRSKFSTRPDSADVDEIELLHVDRPHSDQRAVGATLADLHAAVPGTLQDIADRWPGTLLDIAAEDLS